MELAEPQKASVLYTTTDRNPLATKVSLEWSLRSLANSIPFFSLRQINITKYFYQGIDFCNTLSYYDRVMPNTAGAKKALRSSKKKAVFNTRRKNAMKKTVKLFRESVKAGDLKDAEKQIPTVYKAIDKAQKRGVIKKNSAARKKSRLSSFLNKAKSQQ